MSLKKIKVLHLQFGKTLVQRTQSLIIRLLSLLNQDAFLANNLNWES